MLIYFFLNLSLHTPTYTTSHIFPLSCDSWIDSIVLISIFMHQALRKFWNCLGEKAETVSALTEHTAGK